jgi:hypothetical protein
MELGKGDAAIVNMDHSSRAHVLKTVFLNLVS